MNVPINQQILNCLKNPNANASEMITQLLGFTASAAAERIESDLKLLLNENRISELNGYVLCLSRVMKHELAWTILQNVFLITQKEMPTEFYTWFNKQCPSTA